MIRTSSGLLRERRIQLGQYLSLRLLIDSVLARDGEAPELLDWELDVLLDPFLGPLRFLGSVEIIKR